MITLSPELKCFLEGYIAHSAGGEGEAQTLLSHLQGVIYRASSFGAVAGLEHVVQLAALWHDLGKATPEFQKKLQCSSTRHLDHKGLGAMLAYRRKYFEVALAIAGHHGGIPNINDLQARCQSNTEDAWTSQASYQELLHQIESMNDPLLKAPTDPNNIDPDISAMDLRTRMIFSCLVDADYLDTEEHFRGTSARKEVDFPLLGDLAEMFFQNQSNLMASQRNDDSLGGDLFQLRCQLYEEAIRVANQNPGVFSLTIPTGGGKSRTALGFSFRHANVHGHKRIIIALPYTSILDQMAEEYASIFGKDGFLLHYTGWQNDRDGGMELEESERERRMRLTAENWDAPLVLTTTVQLFNSLFSNRPSACRKLHNLARSILVLDEVQTLPMKYWEPICDVLGLLASQYGVTVVLSTATQPALDRVKSFEKRVGRPKEIVSEPIKAYRILKRVNYETNIDEPWSWEKVLEVFLSAGSSGMIIVNTKKHALDLFQMMRRYDESSFHLSTLMCGAHRRQIITQIKQRLDSGVLCRVISTQLVEAGVNLDFPFVMRAVGPLDRVVQAAGRCNREGKLGRSGGRMIVFKPEDNSMPRGYYETCAGHFEVTARSGRFDPDDPDTFPAYFGRVFEDVDLDSKRINENRKRLMFQTVAEKFELIEAGATRAVFTGYGGPGHRWKGSPAEALLSKLGLESGLTKRHLFRLSQPYTVEIFRNKIDRLKGRLILEDSATGELYWWGKYDDKLGIAEEHPDIDDTIL